MSRSGDSCPSPGCFIIRALTWLICRRRVRPRRQRPLEGIERERSVKMALLEIKNLHARVAVAGGRDILKGVNLTVNAGEVHAIMGKNGSGKSTLAQVLMGRETYEVTDGTILYQGKNLLEM